MLLSFHYLCGKSSKTMSGIHWMHRQHPPRQEHWMRWVWKAFFASIVLMMVWMVFLSFQDLPSFDDLENPNNKLASQVFAIDGALLGRYYVENRVPVTYDQLSPHLVNALIATEDIRFNSHSGIDFRALARVAFKTVFLGQSSSGGGSTITQQLAKLLYSNRDFSGMGKIEKTITLVVTKMKEWITAVKLERSYTKKEILAMYLNHFNFINGAYGIKAASEIYFGQSQDSLSVTEAATLVGMLQNPSLYNPARRAELTRKRRNVVINQMVRHDFLTRDEATVLKESPMDMARFKKFSHDEGLAPYARMELRKEVMRILDRPECRKSNGEKYDIWRDGLKIYSTIDTSVQLQLEASVAAHMPALQKKFWRVWRGMDPWTRRDPGTVDADIDLRQQTLADQIGQMDRYIGIRASLFEPFIEENGIKIGRLLLRDVDMTRMLREKKNPGYLKELQELKLISGEMVKDYTRIMKGPLWKELQKKWDNFQTATDNMLNAKVPMVVFDYGSPRFERDTLMSPLDSLKYHRMILQTGVVAIDPSNGQVRGWVGGVDYRFFQYDHVTSDRQVGSTFKPFVYATAVALQSISPCTRLLDNPQTIVPGEANFHLEKEWTPRNFDTYTGESLTLFDGLRKSKNTFSVYLMKQLGDTEPVRGLINNMGIDSSARTPTGRLRVPASPSICLGSADLSVLEMTGAYATFANDGVYNKPVLVNRIEDAHGRVIYQDVPLERRALSSEANHVMVEMLRYATRGAGGFSGVKSDFGGKTGTTNFYADGWFIGITPSLVIGTWVGGEDRWIRFFSPNDGQGSVLARPIFSEALKRLETYGSASFDPDRRFKSPGKISIELDCGKYQSATGDEIPGDSPDLYEDIFEEPVFE